MIKAIFFDIDGTLVSFNTHKIPQSTIDAVRRVRQQGVKVFIATGRPRPYVDNLGELEYDGILAVNGASFTDAEGRSLICKRIDRNDVRSMVEYQKKTGIVVAFASPDDSFVTEPDEAFMRVYKLLNIKMPAIRDASEALNMDVVQMIAFFSETDETYVMQNVLPNSDCFRWHPDFVDCIQKGNNKATGIDEVIRHYGIDISEVMAFGDGGNDIQMLSHVGIGVAMGNATDYVKSFADVVTDTVDNDGVAKMLAKHFDL